MSNLPYAQFDELVALSVAHARASNPNLTNFSDGDVLLELFRAGAHESQFIQSLSFLLLKQTRLSTSDGADVDSFLADYGLYRQAALAASGNVTFSRYSPIKAATIPVETLVKTEDGEQSFEVVADESHAAWNAAENGYVIQAGVAGLLVPVQAVVPGAAGNVAAGAITLISSPLTGVDVVVNTLPFTTGYNAESDAAARKRFPDYINSRSLGIPRAVGAAIANVQQGISYVLAENTLPNGSERRGFTTIYVDDGTGYPSTGLLSRVSDAVEQVRPLGAEYAVRSPDVAEASVSITPVARPGYSIQEVRQAIQTTVASYINGLGMGVPLRFLDLVAVARGAHDGIRYLEEITVNNGEGDLGGLPRQTVRVSSLVAN
jgi:uncharacterized phage protein gp47/JayE